MIKEKYKDISKEEKEKAKKELEKRLLNKEKFVKK